MFADSITTFVLSLFVAISLIIMPRSATCPEGWWLRDGVRLETGHFACHAPTPDCCRMRNPCGACPEPKIVRSRIYCTGGQIAIQVNDHTVGCQRR